MLKIEFYRNEYYEKLKALLLEVNLFDEIWEDKKSLSKKIEKDPESIILAFKNKEIIGCVFIVEDGRHGTIWRLGVKENSRKKGIGDLLLKKAEEILQNRGIKEVIIFVDPKKEKLIEWYKKRDFTRASDWICMFKRL